MSANACTHEPMEPFEASLALDLFLLRDLRRELAAWLARVRVADELRDDIILATHEAAANAIEHSRNGSDVTVRAERDANKVVIVITNSGRWQEPQSLDETRGRGLALIEHLMSDLDIQVKSQRTVVRMRKDLSAAAPGA